MAPFSTIVLILAAACLLAGCTASQPNQQSQEASASPPPPVIQAWMDRLTVEHEYDPGTGFIVAREVITLPPVLTEAPRLSEAVAQAERDDRALIVFATADRCAPCQQYKRDALTDPMVVARLTASDALATHVEVDRESAAASEILGSLAIPMTYLLRDGEVVASLRGQRSAADLLKWLDEHQL